MKVLACYLVGLGQVDWVLPNACSDFPDPLIVARRPVKAIAKVSGHTVIE